MKSTFTKDNEQLNVCLDGRLDTTTSEDFIAEAQKQMDDKTTVICLNCQKLEYISSAGLRALMMLHEEVVDKGGVVKLQNIGQQVNDVLKMTGMNEFFEIVD